MSLFLKSAFNRDKIIVGVGASAGGLEALTRMFAEVPADVAASFVVIQHLDPEHDSVMAELLNRKTELDVRQASHGEQLLPGTIYLIPPGTGLRIADDRLLLVPFAEPRGVRRPIDDFFLSLSEQASHLTAAVILSGTGADGSMGLQAIKEQGGVVIVQTPDDAKYDGMPSAAIATGAVDRVTDAPSIVNEIMQIYEVQIGDSSNVAGEISSHITEICALVREHTGHDFSGYKRPTLLRRVERRMQMLCIDEPARYVTLLMSDEEEINNLFRDILINVTRFFRDLSNFEVLAQRAIDPLIAGAASGEPLRIWVPGCSTGEEAYTISMICLNAASRYNIDLQLQIFATDIDEHALNQARQGRYPISALNDIPEPYRSRYVDISTKDLQIIPKVRDTVRFSSHNLIRDPAFSRMDLISCRNLFIYFNEKTQYSILPLMHFSLKPSGYLFLGPSESVGDQDKLFASIDRRARLFRKRDVPSTYPREFLEAGLQLRYIREERSANRMPGGSNVMLDVSTRRILEAYTPATITVNDRGEIVSSSGKLARYFEFSGHQSRPLALSVARRGLRDVLGPLLRNVQNERRRLQYSDVNVVSEFGIQKVNVVADPLTDGHTLIVFDRQGEIEPIDTISDDKMMHGDERIHYLEDELEQVRLRLRTTVEELETANEELKSSNEEMMSMNEELQSTNEELTTANDELKIKIDQLDVLNSDLRNFFDSTDLGVVILDGFLRVRAFTPRIRGIFPLRETDKGRHLSEIAGFIDDSGYIAECTAILAGGQPIERLVTVDRNQTSYLMRVLPYLGYTGMIEGVTIAFIDVTDLKDTQDILKKERSVLSLALHIGRAGVISVDRSNSCLNISEPAQELFGVSNVKNMTTAEIVRLVDSANSAEVEKALTRLFMSDHSRFEITFRLADPEPERWLRLIKNEDEDSIVLCQDFTVQMQAEEAQKVLLREMNHRIKNIFAVTASIMRISAPDYESVPDFVESTRTRLAMLARANAATYEVGFDGVIALEALLTSLMEPFSSYNLTYNGPEVAINGADAASLSLIIHEWATNACKYGALSHREGRVSINWHIGPDGMTLRWDEDISTGVSIEKPDKPGFGSVLTGIAAKQIGATLSTEVGDQGFKAELFLSSYKSAVS